MRYADDFIIGIEGSYSMAEKVLQEVKSFVEENLKLKLNPEKTGITAFSEKPFKFLGFVIMAPKIKGIEKPLETIGSKKIKRIIKRRKKIRIRFSLDYDNIIKRLQNNGFIRKRISPKDHRSLIFRGKFKGNLIHLDHADILNYYNTVMRGLYQYYSFVWNMNTLALILWFLTESCCLTLARKFKLKTMSKVFKRFGKDLGCVVSSKKGVELRVSIFKPQNFKRQKRTFMGNINDPLKISKKSGMLSLQNRTYSKNV